MALALVQRTGVLRVGMSHCGAEGDVYRWKRLLTETYLGWLVWKVEKVGPVQLFLDTDQTSDSFTREEDPGSIRQRVHVKGEIIGWSEKRGGRTNRPALIPDEGVAGMGRFKLRPRPRWQPCSGKRAFAKQDLDSLLSITIFIRAFFSNETNTPV